jgi:hypothetical protein
MAKESSLENNVYSFIEIYKIYEVKWKDEENVLCYSLISNPILSFALSLVVRFRVRQGWVQLLVSNTDNRDMILGFLENCK